MLNIPSFKSLLNVSSKLVQNYESRREEFDGQRFFSSWRTSTHNQDRINDATFIQNLAKHINDTKHSYKSIDRNFAMKDYAKEISPYLKKVITGAMLLELIKITNEYMSEASVNTGSALGKEILDLYKVDKLSDISKEEQAECLQNLANYLNVVKDDFHPLKKNAELLSEITLFTPEIMKQTLGV